MPFPRFSFVHLVAVLGMASTLVPALAARPGQAGSVFAVGMAYAPPAYRAGTKFRTPEAIDPALAQNMAEQAGVSLQAVRTESVQARQWLEQGKLDALIAPLPSPGKLSDSLLVIPTGFAARPMAIMRTDTTIKTPEQLRSRKVCVAEGGAYAGMLKARYGATEIVTSAPADALLAVRTGACDAAVHDSALLEELIKLPEWKKFSASLYLGPAIEKAVIVRRGDARAANAAKKTVDAWQRTGQRDQEIKRMVRHIAFEVYLDQDVPDCH